jgi:hypothetical protein
MYAMTPDFPGKKASALRVVIHPLICTQRFYGHHTLL